MSSLVHSRETDPHHQSEAEVTRIRDGAAVLGLTTLDIQDDDGPKRRVLYVSGKPVEVLLLLNALPKPLRHSVKVVCCEVQAIHLEWDWSFES